jgi:hypothetical protein
MSIIAWNKTSSAGRWLRNLGISLAFAAALPGCMAHARGEVVYDYPVTYVERAPARIETYPRAEYHGRPAYLVDGRWYYQNNRRWVVFEDEPGELREYRSRHYARTPVRYGTYSEPVRARRDDRRDDRRAAERRAEQRRAEQRRHEERRAAEARIERRRAEERRDAARRADQRRDAERRAEERRHEERRAEHARNERRRADEQQARDRQAADRRANARRVEDRRDDDRSKEKKARVAERRTQDQRKRDRNRPDDSDRRYRND